MSTLTLHPINNVNIVVHFKGSKRTTIHRLDGPAIDWSSPNSEFYINGTRYAEHQFPKAVANWVSYIEVTKQEINTLIGKYRIVEW